ncbi:uncharacterized protein B0T15DRAFT_535761 [Chaetomium strumarium]|uniref:Uncharacterized protein n=1 Tax=Chaetomium strumarium TaxID=1170767 RepID=A0AAJ0GQC5_9PEZI|nr:hypothetical protein B0T15DRAFT_535761 [Chaetomium strumarium]
MQLPHLPPTYESAVASSTTATSPIREATGDAKQSGHSSAQELKMPTTTQGWATLWLRMVTNPSIPDDATTFNSSIMPWVATLNAKCEDLPRLMREGFFCSADNVVPERGYMSSSIEPEWTAKGYHHARKLILVDKTCSPDETPRWAASLEVVATSVELLSKFRVENLSPENVLSAYAWNTRGQDCYSHHRQFPDFNYNCIYDDKPLAGWWPWPK